MLNNRYFSVFTSVIAFTSALMAPFNSYSQTYPEYVYVDANRYVNEEEENVPVKKTNTGYLWFLGAAAVGIGAGVGIAASSGGGGGKHHKKKVAAANLTAPQSLASNNSPSIATIPQPVVPTVQTPKIENPVISQPVTPSTPSNPEPAPVNIPEPVQNDPAPVNQGPVQGNVPTAPVANKGHSLIFDFTLNVSNTLGGGMTAYVETPDGKILTAAPFSLFSLNRTIVVPDPVYGSYRYGVIISPSLVSVSASLNANISSDIPGTGVHQTLPLALGVVTSQTQMDQEFSYELNILR